MPRDSILFQGVTYPLHHIKALVTGDDVSRCPYCFARGKALLDNITAQGDFQGNSLVTALFTCDNCGKHIACHVNQEGSPQEAIDTLLKAVDNILNTD